MDLRAPLLASGQEDIWYKTDHHWTTAGAFIAYAAISKQLGIEPVGIESFRIDRVSSEFFGTSFSRVGGIWGTADSINLYRYNGDDAYTLRIPQTNTVKKGFYAWEALDGKDKYSVFLGGNYGVMTVVKDGGEERKKLTLIKDSYANSVIPFLAIHYDITVIDPRYYTGDISEILSDTDRVLVLLGADTLATTPMFKAY